MKRDDLSYEILRVAGKVRGLSLLFELVNKPISLPVDIKERFEGLAIVFEGISDELKVLARLSNRER